MTLLTLLHTLRAQGWDCYLHTMTDANGNLKGVLVVNPRTL